VPVSTCGGIRFEGMSRSHTIHSMWGNHAFGSALHQTLWALQPVAQQELLVGSVNCQCVLSSAVQSSSLECACRERRTEQVQHRAQCIICSAPVGSGLSHSVLRAAAAYCSFAVILLWAQGTSRMKDPVVSSYAGESCAAAHASGVVTTW
jgi:hypothetical protein